ncbi:MAG TPA: hypothetical protein PKA28_18460 [Methylomusa anaerophila]|uniref:Transmembrane protein n=1 Tax=Methylomusa anaerophila TaxID=1930071 RepID=A0A348AIQ4_9FIRM|nr:hypothetical protein [Methylomusa anaerophila]BBB90952.1 hypothetical protein MAMMFC1_01619 [Methylomusa anaerophila]HML90421.1 hypothetical protein [Methylomusa anaerophila]
MNYKLFHQTTAAIAFLTIVSFLVSTLVSELIGDHNLIAVVKRTIVYGLSILIVCMPLLVVSGRKLAASYPNNPYVGAKAKRMKWIALNAIIFLIPLAVTLNYLAQNNQLNISFYSLQALEIICGSVNILLFGKMYTDGRQINSEVFPLNN